MAELWGSVVASLLFWGFAKRAHLGARGEEVLPATYSNARRRHVTCRTPPPPRTSHHPPPGALPSSRYYPLFGLGANVALVFSGQFVRYVSGLRRTWAAPGCTGDPWGASLKYLMGGVVVSGSAVRPPARFSQHMPTCLDAASRLLTRRPLSHLRSSASTTTDHVRPTRVRPRAHQKKAKTETKMGLKESAQFLASRRSTSASRRSLAICYGDYLLAMLAVLHRRHMRRPACADRYATSPRW